MNSFNSPFQTPLNTQKPFAREGLALWWNGVDRLALFVMIALMVGGLMLSMAASPAAAGRIKVSDPFYFLYRHAFYVVVSLFVLLGISMLRVRNARRLAVLTMVGALVLMIATLVFGHEVKGAQRWLRFGPLSLQPSEFLKPSLIVFSAWMFSEQQKNRSVPGTSIAFGVYLFAVFLLLQQPDIGQTVLLTLVFCSVFFFAGLSWKWIVFLGGLAMGGAVLAYFSFAHVSSRIQNFLNPGTGDTYQTDKALEAIARGGLFGTGPGEGVVKHSLPDAHTDFIFAVAAEEYGLIAAMVLIGLIMLLLIRGFWGALRQKTLFEPLAAGGLTLLFGLQTAINLAVNLNMAPPKGMTLPFVSYGGSSMLSLAFAGGLLLAFTRKRGGAGVKG